MYPLLQLTLAALLTAGTQASIYPYSQYRGKCPRFCPRISEPLCASDGVIYANVCDMKRRTCGKNVKSVEEEFCTRAQGSKCGHKCSQEYDPVCGTDGRTYLNKCIMQVEKCRRNVKFAHYGSCKNGSAPRENCPVSCSVAPIDGPICGSDGNVYASSCQMTLLTCGQGVVATSQKHCQTTKHCRDICWRVLKPVCGSDLQLYNNECQMRVKNCGKHIFPVPNVHCVPQERHASACPISCDGEPYSPVCGSDGNIYDSTCEMNMLNCGQDVEEVQSVAFSGCATKLMLCNSLTCKESGEPLCGTDGRTYPGECELRRAGCRKKIFLAHNGPCTNFSTTQQCPSFCPETDESDDPVCGSDGNVYRSLCDMKYRTCGQRVVPVDRKHCQTTQFCNETCDKKRQSVCGSDGKIYRNSCEMRSRNCGKFVFEVPLTRCLKGFQFRGCLRICPPLYDPICGSDGKTYSNNCFLEIENCRSRSIVAKKHHGKCGRPEPEAKNYLYR